MGVHQVAHKEDDPAAMDVALGVPSYGVELCGML